MKLPLGPVYAAVNLPMHPCLMKLHYLKRGTVAIPICQKKANILWNLFSIYPQSSKTHRARCADGVCRDCSGTRESGQKVGGG